MTTPLQSVFPGAPTFAIGSDMTLGPSPLADNLSQVGDYSASDMVTWTHGRHTLRFGGEYKREYINELFNAYTRGEEFFLSFPNANNWDESYLAMFLGVPTITLQGSGDPTRNIRANDFNLFFQDDWRLNDQFVLNLGVRYEVFGQFFETHGKFVEFDPTLATFSGPYLTGGFVQAGNGSLPGIPKVGNGLAPNDYNNVGPRIGFSWKPFRDYDRFVFRGGYGMYFDRPNARLLNSQVFDSPYDTVAMAVVPPNWANPFVQVPLPSAYPIFPAIGEAPYIMPLSGTTGTVVPASGIYPNRHDFVTPYVQQWNFGMQWEMAKNTMLDVAYVGSKGTKLTRLINVNQAAWSYSLAAPGPFYPAMSTFPNAALGTTVVQTDGASIYNSLQASVTKRFSHGLQFLASYTWSHSIDDYSGGQVNDLEGLPGDNSGPHQFAASDFDRRQRFVVSFVYDLPKFYKGGDRIARDLANSWQISGIVTLQSGMPFNIIYGGNVFQNAYGTLVPGRTIASAVLSGSVESRLNGYFDTTAFEANTTLYPGLYASYGNSGRNSMLGPGQKNVDFSVVKFIPITETQKFEFRTEFFNLFNHPNFANPVSIVGTPAFGDIVSTATGPRVIQFAFKYNF